MEGKSKGGECGRVGSGWFAGGHSVVREGSYQVTMTSLPNDVNLRFKTTSLPLALGEFAFS